MLSLGLGLGLNAGLHPQASENAHHPELLLQTALTLTHGQIDEGTLVRHLAMPWLEIKREVDRNDRFLFEFSKHPREFEEFLAACYDRAGFDEVILTPRSDDKGRDVIAIIRGKFQLRILDQAKAFSPGRLVGQNDVRAMLHVIQNDRAASKGYVTTTSDFAPGITKPDSEFAPYLPTRLELRNGAKIAKWISDLSDPNS